MALVKVDYNGVIIQTSVEDGWVRLRIGETIDLMLSTTEATMLGEDLWDAAAKI